jgi:hypothetical protein
MHLVSVFQHSVYLELALLDLERTGIPKEKILALSLDKGNFNYLSSVRASHQEGQSYVDLLFIGGMLGMLLGGIYGFVLDFGPVIWGLIGMIGGAVVGLLVEFLLSGPKMFKRTTTADVVLIVDCSDAQTAAVERILWQHQPLGVAKQPMSTAD